MSESTTEQDPVSSQDRTGTPAGADGSEVSANGKAEENGSAEDGGTAAEPTDAEAGTESESTAGPGVDNGAGRWVDDATPSAGSDPADAAVTDPAEIGVAADSVPSEIDGERPDAPVSGEALLVQEGEIAGDYLEQLLDILDYDGDIDLDVEGSRAIVAIVGADDLDPLVGARGVTLDALQELTRLTVAQHTGVRTRLMLDVAGYRAGRRTELSELAATSVVRVIDNGETVRMAPMNAFERKIVHDVVTATEGVRSESEGEDPDRRVVILPDR
ncbi:MAG: R3H domain-containing nucleic acid-binding protein [Geodermatophilaceae bacterium]